MSADFHVFDGTDDTINCTGIDHVEWSYNAGVYLHGAAAMYSVTAAVASSSSPEWAARVIGLMNTASQIFFSSLPNATGVMLEQACEPARICNTDQASFKGYLARWMAKAAVLAPFISVQVAGLLANSSLAAAQSCSGGSGAGGTTECGTAWWTAGYDGETGLGQQLSALETVQALLAARVPAPAIASAASPSPPPPSSATPSTTLACPSANNTTYTSPSSPGTTFTIECAIDHTGGDLAFTGAATLAACIDACAAVPGGACVALAFEPGSPGPCWLKGSAQPGREASGVWGAVRVG